MPRRNVPASRDSSRTKVGSGPRSPEGIVSRSASVDKPVTRRRTGDAALIFTTVGILPWTWSLAVASKWTRTLLHPLFGSIPTSLHHHQVVLLLDLLVTSTVYLYRIPSDGVDVGVLATTIAYHAPTVVWWLAPWSGRWGPHVGPILFQCFLYWPVRILSLVVVTSQVVSFCACVHS